MKSFKTFSETVLNSKKQAFISYLHRIMWVGIQITRLEGPEDYTLFKNELNYFGKIFPLFFTFPKHCHGVTSWSLGTWLWVAAGGCSAGLALWPGRTAPAPMPCPASGCGGTVFCPVKD